MESKKITIKDLPDLALHRIFDYLSTSSGKRVLYFAGGFRCFENNRAPWRLAQTCSRFRTFFLKQYATDVTICSDGCHTLDEGPLFSSEVFVWVLEQCALKRLVLKSLCTRVPHSDYDCVFSHALDTRNIDPDYFDWLESAESNDNKRNIRIMPSLAELCIEDVCCWTQDCTFESIPVSFPNLTSIVIKNLEKVQLCTLKRCLRTMLEPLAKTLVSLNLTGFDVDNMEVHGALTVIAQLTRLEHLDLSGWDISDATQMASLTRMTHLCLRDCHSVSDASLAPVLATMPNLKSIDVFNTTVSPAIAAVLPPSITSISAGIDPSIGAPALAYALLNAMVHNTPASAAPVRTAETSHFSLERHPQLSALSWGGWTTQKQGWASIAPIALQVTNLVVRGVDFNDDGADLLRTMTQLENLSFHRTAISGRSVDVVRTLPSLRRLEFDCCEQLSMNSILKMVMGASLQNKALRVLRLGALSPLMRVHEYQAFADMMRVRYPFLSVYQYDDGAGRGFDDSPDSDEEDDDNGAGSGFDDWADSDWEDDDNDLTDYWGA